MEDGVGFGTGPLIFCQEKGSQPFACGEVTSLCGHWQVTGTTAGLVNVYLNIVHMQPQEWLLSLNLPTR